MLTNAQIEARVLNIFDAIKSGAKYEDSLVELKSDWPSAEKAARRIAGHANAARGEDFLWIIGMNEEHGVCPLPEVELADWWAQVQRCFDGPTPSLKSLVVPTPDGQVHVFYLDSGRSPYVVKNPNFGKKDGGPIEREVPWREGTSVRTATREDLVRLLVPVLRLPEVEILNASVVGRKSADSQIAHMEAADPKLLEQIFHGYVYVEMYVIPPQDALVILPLHRTSITVHLDVDGTTSTIEGVSYQTPTWGINPTDRRLDSVSVETTSSEAIVRLPGRLILTGNFTHKFRGILHPDAMTIVYTVQPIHTDRVLQTEVRLLLTKSNRDGELRWELDS